MAHDEVLMPRTLDEVLRLSQVLARSGVLPEGLSSPEAVAAVILIGRELGLPPMQSLRGIHIVRSKKGGANPTLSAKLMGALIFRDGHSYTVDEASDTRCVITFTRSDGEVYTQAFTLDDAKKAGLVGRDMWRMYPRAMLFSRCLSAGASAVMPDAISGMYTPEELADPGTLVMDAETGEVVPSASEPTDVVTGSYQTPPPESDEPKLRDVPRPWPPEVTAKALRMRAERGESLPAHESQIDSVRDCVGALVGDAPDEARELEVRDLLRYVFEVDDADALTSGQAEALIAWASTDEQDAMAEMSAVLRSLFEPTEVGE